MWIFFLTGPLVFVIAAIVYARASARDRNLRYQAEQEEAARLGEHGQLLGSARDAYQLTARVGDVPVSLNARVTRRVPRAKPPTGEDDDASRTVWLAKVPLDVSPRIVLRRTDTVYVFDREGTAMATGNAEFDRSYVTAPSAEGSAYRGASDDGTRWIAASVAQRLRDLDLQWIEAKDGAAELAFGALGPRSVGTAMTTAANLVRTVHGQSELPCGREPLERPSGDPVDGSAATLVGGAAIATVLGAPLGAAIGFIGPVHDAVADLSCGPGEPVIITSSEDDEGTSYGMQCRDHPEASIALVYLLALCIWCTLVMTGGLVLALRSWPSRALSA